MLEKQAPPAAESTSPESSPKDPSPEEPQKDVLSFSIDGVAFCAVAAPDVRFNGLYEYPGKEMRFWEYVEGEPVVELGSNQTGRFQHHGVPPLKITWWIESDCKGKIQKAEAALGEQYILVVRFEETGKLGYPVMGSFSRMTLDVYREGNKMIILGERIKRN